MIIIAAQDLNFLINKNKCFILVTILQDLYMTGVALKGLLGFQQTNKQTNKQTYIQ